MEEGIYTRKREGEREVRGGREKGREARCTNFAKCFVSRYFDCCRSTY